MIETRHTSLIGRQLADAAFGDRPGSWPLPSATTPAQLWLRAVAAGGQGRYGAAFRDLATLRRSAPGGRLESLGMSTQGSFLRQLGWHTVARGWDGRALAVAGGDPEAGADALIGLAADALGVGRFAAAETLLARAEPLPASPDSAVPDRLAVRRRWVAAELAMARGDGDAAVRLAGQGVELAAAMTVASPRHRAKSDVVLAAALCCAGSLERSRTVADAALQTTERLGLLPLRWALACLLIDIESVTFPTHQLHEIRDVCAGQVRHAGGTWRSA